MTPKQPIRVFGSRAAVAALCRTTEAAVAQWDKRGGIPYDKQCLLELEAIRLGKRGLRARWEDDPKHRQREAA